MATIPTTNPKRACAHDSSEEVAIICNGFVGTMLSCRRSILTALQKKKGLVTEVNAAGVAERSLASIKDRWQTLKKNAKDKVASSVRIKRRQREREVGEKTTRWMTRTS